MIYPSPFLSMPEFLSLSWHLDSLVLSCIGRGDIVVVLAIQYALIECILLRMPSAGVGFLLVTFATPAQFPPSLPYGVGSPDSCVDLSAIGEETDTPVPSGAT